MPNEKEMINVCIENGVHKACMIDVDKIPFDEGLRAYCDANQCGCLGINYGCPPFVGDTKEVITKAKSFKKALVYQTIGKLTDSLDIEGMKDSMIRHSEVADRIGEELAIDPEKHLDLRAGPCVACKECAAINNETCKYPEKRRISLEAYCINVSSLAKVCDMNYINGENTVTYFGAFLIC